MQAQGKTMTRCTVRHFSRRRNSFIAYALYLLVAGTVTNCSIVSQIGILVREKVHFIPHENQDLPRLASLYPVFIKVQAKKFRSPPFMFG